VCIVGYTNAGKSTLLNSLTRSRVYTADRMFATLDPCTRRLRLSPTREVLITDTVGFIRDLPPDLIAAFRATLEELHEAHVLLHVIDGSSPSCEKQIRAVEDLLEELELGSVPRIAVFNKADIADPDELTHLCRRYDGLAVSALDPSTLPPLLERMTEALQGPVLVRRAEEALRVV
jgi:GTP-binding protein HflX